MQNDHGEYIAPYDYYFTCFTATMIVIGEHFVKHWKGHFGNHHLYTRWIGESIDMSPDGNECDGNGSHPNQCSVVYVQWQLVVIDDVSVSSKRFL